MDGIISFFAFIFSPIQMFLQEVFVGAQSAANYVLSFLMSLFQGLLNVLMAIVDLINIRS